MNRSAKLRCIFCCSFSKFSRYSLAVLMGLVLLSDSVGATFRSTNLQIAQQPVTNSQDAIRAAAQKAYSEGSQLYKQGTAESLRQAIEKWKQAVPLWRQVGDKAWEALTLAGIGRVYSHFGDRQQALNYYNEALALTRLVDNKWGEAITLNNIGLVYSDLGDKQQALNYYNQALRLTRLVDNKMGEATTLNNIGLVYWDLRNNEQALKYYKLALPLTRQTDDKAGEATTLHNIALIYSNLGDKQQALNYYNEALRLTRLVGDKMGEARSLNNIGLIYSNLGDKQQALNHYNEALPLTRLVGDKSGEVITHRNIAFVKRDQGNLEESLKQIETAIKIVEDLRTKVVSQDLRTSYFASVQGYYKLYIDLLMQLHKKNPSKRYDAQALHASERSRARSLIELLTEAHADIRKGVDPKLLEVERSLLFRLETRQKQLNKANERQAAALKTEIENLLSQYQELQVKIRTTSPKYANLKYPNPLTLPQIQQQLDKDTLLLQYSLSEERSYLWAVTPNSMQSYELPGRKEIEQKVEELRKLLRDFGMNQVSPEKTAKAADQLSQLILAPVAKDLAQKRLLIVADGALQYIPFTVLTVPKSSVSADNYQPLLLNHEIVSLPSATTIDILRQELKGRQKAPKTIAILADPVFSSTDERVTGVVKNPSLNKNNQPTTKTSQTAIELDKSALTRATRDINLPNIDRRKETRTQAEEIIKLVPQSERLHAFDFDANYTWATNPQLSQYRYLLFATHGILNDINPELSGIVLSQIDKNGNQQQKGFLQLPDLFNLDYPAELLVLSACETGLGKEVKGEGLVGLTRGLMYAGAARVVVSLWKVNDEATSKLMSEFYREILQQGKTPAAAMRAAQLKMWQQEKWRNPHSWAGFILQGEWR